MAEEQQEEFQAMSPELPEPDLDAPRGKGIGTATLRKEDAELITGQGRYVDDVKLPGMLHLSFVRSQVAHTTDVDEHGRRRQPQLHQRDERHAAGEELRVLAVLADERDRLGGRTRADVLERGGDHLSALTMSAAASTDFTMLW